MRDKHIHIPRDSELQKLIYKQVQEQLMLDQKKINWVMGLKCSVYFPLIIASYFYLYQTNNAILFLGCFIFYGFASLLLAFNFAHDFSHNTIFKNKQWNNISFILIYTMVGAHGESWKQRHIHSHHYAPNVEHYDSDLKISSLIRVIPGSKHRWYHCFQHWYAPFAYITYSLFWVFIKDVVLLFSANEHGIRKGITYHLSFWTQKTFYLVYLLALPLLLANQPWHIVITGFILMHLFQSIFLLITFFITHHVETTAYPTTDKSGAITTSWLMNQIKSSNDFYPFSRVANFIFGGFNNHIAHHLFPHINSIYYPALNKILYKVLMEHHITPNETTYVGGIVSHLRLLKKMSSKEAAPLQ